MFQIRHKKVQQALEHFVPNYRINFIDAKKITETSHFETDLQIMFEMLKYRKNTNELLNYIDEHSDYFSHLDYESQQAIAALLPSEKLVKEIRQKAKEDMNMCKALDDWFDEAHKTGFESGKLDGLKIGIKNTITALRMNQTSDDIILTQIAELYNMPVDEVRSYM